MARTSTDGRAWEPAPDSPALTWWAAAGPTPVTGQGAIQGTSMVGVAVMPDGVLAVGMRWGLDPTASPDANGQRPMLIHGALWRSDDGRAWEILPDAAFAFGRTTSGGLSFSLSSAAADGDRILVYGVAPELGVTVWQGTPAR